MKWMIASDLHGSAWFCRQLMEAFDREQPDRLLLLGDLLYHGPRNDLPREYDPKQVLAMLNEKAERIVCVRGNCDAEVDQMVLQFPIMADLCVLAEGTRLIYATHGHVYSEQQPPKLRSGDVLLAGHTHVPVCREHDGWWYLNPGSVSIPKEGSWNAYMTLESGTFLWKNLEGQVQMEHRL